MLIKGADDRSEDIAELTALLSESNLTPSQRKNIEKQMKDLHNGAWGEQQAAYFLNFHFEGYKNTLILHDLRLVLSNGKTAQIDHLIINKFLDIYVLESKNWKQLTVDKTGACTIWDGRVVGVPSPLEQCRRHVSVLARTFQVCPELKALAPRQNIMPRVLVATDCHLKAPHHQEWYVKSDAFHSAWERDIDDASTIQGALSITRIVRRETLIKIGRTLLELHNPVRRNWRAQFGLTSLPSQTKIPPNRVVSSIDSLADHVPRWGENWFVLKGVPTEATKKAIKAAGYRAKQENGEWVWRLTPSP